jgi:hypothetical protein
MLSTAKNTFIREGIAKVCKEWHSLGRVEFRRK